VAITLPPATAMLSMVSSFGAMTTLQLAGAGLAGLIRTTRPFGAWLSVNTSSSPRTLSSTS